MCEDLALVQRQTDRLLAKYSAEQKKKTDQVINARRMRTRVIVLILCVCPPFSRSIRRLYCILNIAIGFTLHLKGFQLTDFAEKASFVSYTNSNF